MTDAEAIEGAVNVLRQLGDRLDPAVPATQRASVLAASTTPDLVEVADLLDEIAGSYLTFHAYDTARFYAHKVREVAASV